MINLSANTLFILSKMDTDSKSPIGGNIPSNLLILHDPLQRQDHYLMQVRLCHCLHLHTAKQVSHKRPLCTKEIEQSKYKFSFQHIPKSEAGGLGQCHSPFSVLWQLTVLSNFEYLTQERTSRILLQ